MECQKYGASRYVLPTLKCTGYAGSGYLDVMVADEVPDDAHLQLHYHPVLRGAGSGMNDQLLGDSLDVPLALTLVLTENCE